MDNITTYTTAELKEMRDYQMACEAEGINVTSDFTLTDLVQELTRRNRLASERHLTSDCQEDQDGRKMAIDAACSF